MLCLRRDGGLVLDAPAESGASQAAKHPPALPTLAMWNRAIEI